MGSDPYLRLTLRQGTVTRMLQRSLTSPLPHYCVVMNKSPLSSACIVLSIFTSKVELRRELVARQRLPPQTLVFVSPSEYAELSVPSVIDCNSVYTVSMKNYAADVAAKTARPCRDLPPGIVAKVVEGIQASPKVSDEVKRLVRP